MNNIEIAVKTRLGQPHETMRNGVMKERKKPGLKKARKASQFSKR
ncbi:30S ribosomal protein S9 [Lactiplantibacillus plantarum]|nr:30S ribosomal protein S9 [Lactiplantibacillus plantarum]WGJ12844.1 30S ribosomal protein S9 [Lactiplantibacillus plantarum]